MNIRITLLIILTLFSSSLLAESAEAARPKIAWFSTLQNDLSDKSGFWKSLHDLMAATAADLDVDFQIYYAQENFLKMHQQVNDVLSNKKTRPDGIIFHNYKKLAPLILEKAEQYGVKSFIFNSGLNEENQTVLPRQQYKHWIGQMLPDDTFAGLELTRCLLHAAKKHEESQEPLQLLAMEGNLSSRAYQARKSGLEGFLQSTPGLKLNQYFPAEWSRSKAHRMFSTMLGRYPQTRIIWSANDNMALGLIDAAHRSEYVLGKDLFIGGVDWLAESIGVIQRGDMACSIGGHFVEGMWALILMYDYLNGFDFANESLQFPSTFHTKMAAITPQNVAEFGSLGQKLSPKNLSKINFRHFSKHHNSEIVDYNFSITRFLKQL